MKIDSNLIKKIKENAPLEEKEDIVAHINFVGATDHNKGVIFYGEVQRNFYQDLIENASEPMKHLERVQDEALGNHILEDGEGNQIKMEFSTRKLSSPLQKKAKQIQGKHYKNFINLGLIVPPESYLINKFDESKYPKLRSYDYFNDPEVYTKYKKKQNSVWTGRMRRDYAKEMREEKEKQDYLFSE
jgi:hypothetical protein